jgi:hypothetical protein
VSEADVAQYDQLDAAADPSDVESEPSAAETDQALDRLNNGGTPKRKAAS